MTNSAQASRAAGPPRRALFRGVGAAAALSTLGGVSAHADTATAKKAAWQRISLPSDVESPSRLVDVATAGGSLWAGGSHEVDGVERPLVVSRLDGRWGIDDFVTTWKGRVTCVAAASDTQAWIVVDSPDLGPQLLVRRGPDEWYAGWSQDGTPQRVVASGGEVWSVVKAEDGACELHRLLDPSWEELPAPPGTVYALAARSRTEVWVAGDMRVAGSEASAAMLARFDGTDWQVVPVAGTPRSAFTALQLGPSGEVWAGGTAGFIGRPPPLPLRPLLGRVDDGTWQPVEAPVDFGPVAALSGRPGRALTWIGFAGAVSRTTAPDGSTSYDDGPTFARWNGTRLVPHDEPHRPGEKNMTELGLAVDGTTTWAAGSGLDGDGRRTARLLRTPPR